MKQKTVDELQKLIKGLNTFHSPEIINSNSDLFALGILDSLLLIQFVMAIENNFQIEIGNDDINYSNFKDLETLANLIESKYLVKPFKHRNN